jgi:hypothetical protein
MESAKPWKMKEKTVANKWKQWKSYEIRWMQWKTKEANPEPPEKKCKQRCRIISAPKGISQMSFVYILSLGSPCFLSTAAFSWSLHSNPPKACEGSQTMFGALVKNINAFSNCRFLKKGSFQIPDMCEYIVCWILEPIWKIHPLVLVHNLGAALQ